METIDININECNQLIDAYMGHPLRDASELKYYTSWDALMPVVDKIYHDVNSYMKTVISFSFHGNIDLMETYVDVVLYIKWHNQKHPSKEKRKKGLKDLATQLHSRNPGNFNIHS